MNRLRWLVSMLIAISFLFAALSLDGLIAQVTPFENPVVCGLLLLFLFERAYIYLPFLRKDVTA